MNCHELCAGSNFIMWVRETVETEYSTTIRQKERNLIWKNLRLLWWKGHAHILWFSFIKRLMFELEHGTDS